MFLYDQLRRLIRQLRNLSLGGFMISAILLLHVSLSSSYAIQR